MSDQGQLSSPSNEDRLQASHDSRRKFQIRAYAAGLLIIIASCMIILVGVVMWPPQPCLPKAMNCAVRPDWGMAIVTKAQLAVPMITLLLGTLGGWVAGTLWRGASDAKTGSGQ